MPFSTKESVKTLVRPGCRRCPANVRQEALPACLSSIKPYREADWEPKKQHKRTVAWAALSPTTCSSILLQSLSQLHPGKSKTVAVTVTRER